MILSFLKTSGMYVVLLAALVIVPYFLFSFELIWLLVYITVGALLYASAIEESSSHTNDFMIKLFTIIVWSAILGNAFYRIQTYEPYSKVTKTIHGKDYNITYFYNSSKDTIKIYLSKNHKIVDYYSVNDKYLENIEDIKKGNFVVEEKDYTTWWSQSVGSDSLFEVKRNTKDKK